MKLSARNLRSAAECRAVGRRLQSYLDGELDGRRREFTAAHLEACRDCGLELETYREVKESLSGERTPIAADAFDRLRSFGENLVAGEGS